MAEAKIQLFDHELQNLAALFKALGHPARLQILKFLAEKNACFSGDITEEVPLGRTTVNQHLNELKKAGLIQGHVSGTKTNYCLSPEGIRLLSKGVNAFINQLSDCECGEC